MSSKLDNLLFHFNQLSEAEQAKFIAAVKTSGKAVTLEDLLRRKRDDGIAYRTSTVRAPDTVITFAPQQVFKRNSFPRRFHGGDKLCLFGF